MTNKQVYEAFAPFANIWWDNIKELLKQPFGRNLTEEESADIYKKLNGLYEVISNSNGVILRDFVEEFSTPNGGVDVRKASNPSILNELQNEIDKVRKDLYSLPAFQKFHKDEWVRSLSGEQFQAYSEGKIHFVMPPLPPKKSGPINSSPHLDPRSDQQILENTLSFLRSLYKDFAGLRQTLTYKPQDRKLPKIHRFDIR